MKKTVAFLLVTVCIFLFSCTGEQAPFGKELSVAKVLTDSISVLNLSSEAEMYCSQSAEGLKTYELDDDILSGKYGELLDCPTTDMILQYAAYYSFDMYDTEFGIFQMKDKASAEKMKAYISDRIKAMQRNAVNYPSVDTSLIDDYFVVINDNWVYYGATRDNGKFKETVAK